MIKRIILFFIIIICINSCYDIAYVGISDRYMGTFKSREKLFGEGYDKYLYLNIRSGGLITYFGGEGDSDINGIPEYEDERITFINFIGDGNVYSFSNNEYTGKIIFYSDEQASITMKGNGIFNLQNIICDKVNN
ncbi:hypothetical protein [Brachyspira sp. SAP_772]|uniref:hypothetical protein n=1 Tax=Brachyspira sp. SAP_772 TaxID=2608385 RepID=UPI0012F4A2B7|nr:hypothetical protein [Brachyspira sp. SAP_772]